LALEYEYGNGAYGVGQYATSVYAVSSTSAVATAGAERIRLGAASAGSVSGETASGQRVREAAGSADSFSGVSAQAQRVRESGATADSVSAANNPSGEFIVAAAFLPTESTSGFSADSQRVGTSGATVASISGATIVAERIQQPAANAASFSGFTARGNYRAKGQAFSQTTVSASASTGRILWINLPDNPPANWQTIGANGQPLAA
jgi:hypothetical protein